LSWDKIRIDELIPAWFVLIGCIALPVVGAVLGGIGLLRGSSINRMFALLGMTVNLVVIAWVLYVLWIIVVVGPFSSGL
jgi:hypothetical protein